MEELIWIGSSCIKLLEGDITAQAVDAVVNAANSSLMGGSGVDGAIHRQGGTAILEACKELRRTLWTQGLPTGEAALTTGGSLPARYVIHTVGPVYARAGDDAPTLLASCYRRSMEVAMEHEDIRTLAFPAISTGVYGYPMDEAAQIALQSVADFLREVPGTFDEVRFVLWGQQAYSTFLQALEERRA